MDPDAALQTIRVCAAAAAELLNDLYEEVLRLTTERDEARAEVERLRAERDEARSVLREVRSWRRAAVGLEPRPTIDAETLDRRIDAVLGPPYREKDPSDPLRMVRALAKAERERDDARAEVERLKAKVADLRERVQCRRDRPWCDCSALERERDEARELAAEMWTNAAATNAAAWTGPTASSHYRSEISERLVRLKTGGAGGSDRIGSLEQLRAAQAEKERDEARAEVEQLKQELSCGHAFHKCSVAEKEAEIRRTQAVEAERDEAREAYLTIRRERDEARANTIRHAQAVQLERERLAACLVRIGADLDLSNPDDNAVDAAIGILDAYRETGPWPGCPWPLRVPEAETEPDES